MTNDIWQFTDENSKIFTDSAQVLKMIFKLKKNKDISGIYYYKGKVIGWDLIIPNTLLKRVNAEIKSISKSQKLKEIDKSTEKVKTKKESKPEVKAKQEAKSKSVKIKAAPKQSSSVKLKVESKQIIKKQSEKIESVKITKEKKQKNITPPIKEVVKKPIKQKVEKSKKIEPIVAEVKQFKKRVSAKTENNIVSTFFTIEEPTSKPTKSKRK